MRHHGALTLVGVAVLALGACDSDQQQPPADRFLSYPQKCFGGYENILDEVVGELYSQRREPSGPSGSPTEISDVPASCRAQFSTNQTATIGAPVDRIVFVNYWLFRTSDGAGDPVSRAKNIFVSSLQRVPVSVDRHPVPIGEEGSSWYQTTPTSGGNVTFRDHNLVVTVVLNGKDKAADGTEAPMKPADAEAGAVKLAKAVAANL